MYTATHQPLFIAPVDPNSFFDKEASIAKMPDDEKKWPSHILSELYKQLPFLSSFDVDINISKIEAEAGYGFGYAILRNKTARAVATKAKGAENLIRVPLIVTDRQLQPFHVFEVGGEVYPLTKERVQEAMVNPGLFDGPSKLPKQRKSLIDQLYPPYQQRQGFGGLSTQGSSGLSKLSSVGSAESMTPAQLRQMATLRSTEKADAASKGMTAGERTEQAVRAGIVPTLAGAGIGALRGVWSTPGGVRARLGGAALGTATGAGMGAGISAVNTGVQAGQRKSREAQRKKLGLKMASIDELRKKIGAARDRRLGER